MTTDRRPTQRHEARRRVWVGVGILMLGAILRLAGFEEAGIGGDQSSILGLAATITDFRYFPLIGMKSSVGMWQTATVPYLAAIPFFIIRRAIAVKWFFSMLDLIAIALLFYATTKTFGLHAGWISALLYATNPWIVEFDRWIWYQTLITTFAAATLAFLLLAIHRERPRSNGALAGSLVAAALMGTVHIVALPWAGLVALVILLVSWRRRLWKGLAIGAAGAGLIGLPYLIYLLQTKFADIVAFVEAGTQGNGQWNFSRVLNVVKQLVTGQHVFSMIRNPLWAESTLQIPWAYDALWLLFGAGVLAMTLKVIFRRRNRAETALLIGWSVLAPLPFLRTSVPIQQVYILFILPAPLILLGVWVQSWLDGRLTGLWNQLQRALGAGIAVCLIVTALWWASQWTTRIALEQESRLGAPTRARLMDQTAETVRHYLQENPDCQVILLNDFWGDLSPFDWIPTLVDTDRVRVAPAGRGTIIPHTCTCYMLGPGASLNDLSVVAEQATHNPDMTIPAKQPWTFHCIPQREESPEAKAVWWNGLHLLQADVPDELKPGEEMEVTYIWEYEQEDVDQYHFFSHLLQGEDLVAQADGPGVPAWYWRDGDWLVTHFTIPLPDELPSGSYRLRVGVYGWPDLERVLLEDGTDVFVVARWNRR